MTTAGVAGATYWGVSEYNKSKSKQKKALKREASRETKIDMERERKRIKNIDNLVAGQINSRFLSGELTKVIEIHTVVEEGIVKLYGTVPSPKIVQRAIAIAKSTKGVKEVISYINVVEMKIVPVDKKTSLANPLEPRKIIHKSKPNPNKKRNMSRKERPVARNQARQNPETRRVGKSFELVPNSMHKGGRAAYPSQKRQAPPPLTRHRDDLNMQQKRPRNAQEERMMREYLKKGTFGN